MKILFINRMLTLVRGGGETFDLEMAKQLSMMGCEIDFLSSRPLLRGALLPVPTEHFKTCARSYVLASPFLGWFPWDKVKGGWRLRSMEYRLFERKAIKWVMHHGHEYDVIQICELPYVVSELKRRGFEKPLVMRLTAPNYGDHWQGVQKADRIIASGMTISALQNEIRPDVVDISNSVDMGMFHAHETNYRGRIGLDESHFIMLYVARFQAFKDHETLVRALDLVVKERPECHLIFAGSGHTERVVKALCEELGLSDSVTFLGETVYEELPDIYAAVDLMVISSIYESFCFAAIEAMATALPVVTTDNGWVPVLIGNNDSAVNEGTSEHPFRQVDGGLIVPVGDATAFADAILWLIPRQTLRKKMGKSNQAVVENKYCWEQNAGKLLATYQSLM